MSRRPMGSWYQSFCDTNWRRTLSGHHSPIPGIPRPSLAIRNDPCLAVNDGRRQGKEADNLARLSVLARCPALLDPLAIPGCERRLKPAFRQILAEVFGHLDQGEHLRAWVEVRLQRIDGAWRKHLQQG